MTELDTRTGYRRRDEVLWREAGGYVLVFNAPSPSPEVLELSGIQAALWRVLDRPLSTDGLRRAISAQEPAAWNPGGGDTPDEDPVERALGDLVELGLVAPARTGAS